MNVICLIGRLTREPELRYTTSNIPVCRFTIAVDRSTQEKASRRRTSSTAWRGGPQRSLYPNTLTRESDESPLPQINTWENEEGRKCILPKCL